MSAVVVPDTPAPAIFPAPVPVELIAEPLLNPPATPADVTDALEPASAPPNPTTDESPKSILPNKIPPAALASAFPD